jgi:hypothetical protein
MKTSWLETYLFWMLATGVQMDYRWCTQLVQLSSAGRAAVLMTEQMAL